MDLKFLQGLGTRLVSDKDVTRLETEGALIGMSYMVMACLLQENDGKHVGVVAANFGTYSNILNTKMSLSKS